MVNGKHKISFGRILNGLGLIVLGFITLYPFIFLVSTSLSAPSELSRNSVVLLPRGLTLSNYAKVIDDSKLWNGYKNTLIMVTLDIVVGVTATTMMAYPLSVRGGFEKYSNPIMKMVMITMYFSGGMIPTYLLVKTLGLIDTFWSITLPATISSFHLIITRTFMRDLPSELSEAASIDGANDIYTFFKIILPLCMPIIAVVMLYRAVGTWNCFMSPLLYLNSPEKYPLQVYLRQLLSQTTMQDYRVESDSAIGKLDSTSIRACIMVVSTLPILIGYPFLQKYFVKGMMIGSVKG